MPFLFWTTNYCAQSLPSDDREKADTTRSCAVAAPKAPRAGSVMRRAVDLSTRADHHPEFVNVDRAAMDLSFETFYIAKP